MRPSLILKSLKRRNLPLEIALATERFGGSDIRHYKN
jgi:hypothetical protein